jgi:hypothetical protein
MEKAAVKMCDIIKKMREHMPEGLLGDDILLATMLAITTLYDSAAV